MYRSGRASPYEVARERAGKAPSYREEPPGSQLKKSPSSAVSGTPGESCDQRWAPVAVRPVCEPYRMSMVPASVISPTVSDDEPIARSALDEPPKSAA